VIIGRIAFMCSAIHPLFVAVVTWFPCAVGVNANQKPLLSAEDVLGIRWTTSPAVSPDGKTVAFIVLEWADAAKNTAERQTTLWLAAADGATRPRQVAAKHMRVARPQWSPDGKVLAFLSPRDPKTGKKQIFLLANDEESATILTNAAEDVQSFQWSPDGKEIAYLTMADSKDAKPLASDENKFGKPLPSVHLWVVDVGTKKAEQVTNRKHIIDFCWAPDCKQFAAVESPTSDLDDSIAKSALVVLDRVGGQVIRTLSTNVGSGVNIAWSPNGKTIVFPEYTEKKIARRLALISPSGGACRYVLDDYFGYPLDPIEWCSDSRYLRVRAFEKTRCQLLRVDTVQGDFKRLTGAVQNFWSFSADRDDRVLVVTAESGQMPPNIVVLENGQAPRRLTDMNPQFAGFRLGNVKEIRWKSKKDGQIIYGVLVTPEVFQPGQPCPTIVELHGGPQGMWWNGWLGTYMSRGQFLASHGYAVLLPNPRGSINYGVKFVEANYRDWGGGDLQDVLDGIDYLIGEKIADPNRLAVGGTSYGGYLSAWATTQTDRFRAAVVDAGSTDLVTLNLTIDVPTPLRRYFGGDEIRDRPFFLSRSPLTYIDRCKTPTLVLHGENDERAPLAQGRAWGRGLELLGIESEMVIYPGEGHGLTKRENQLDVMRRVLAWYEKHLKKK
jgi:dipeptidyl aminopeptidase/acylaminoacyl peptidase